MELHRDLLDFLSFARDPYRTIEWISERLSFNSLPLVEKWSLEPGGRYFCRFGSFACAFILPTGCCSRTTLSAVHVDSPVLKLNGPGIVKKGGQSFFHVDRCGSPIYTTWFDRDLQLTGKIVTSTSSSSLSSVNVQWEGATLSSVPIHLDREKNERHVVVVSDDLLPRIPGGCNSLEELLQVKPIHSFDLYLTPLEPARQLGDSIASYGLDNRISVFVLTEALSRAKAHEETLLMALFYNDEETGSKTLEGADSSFVSSLLERIFSLVRPEADREDFFIFTQNSSSFSLDVAAAFMANRDSKFNRYSPVEMGGGIVFKRSHQKQYSFDLSLEAKIKQMGYRSQVYTPPVGAASGATLGPYLSIRVGIPTLDLGIAIGSMHSARELVAIEDVELYQNLLDQVYFRAL